MSQGLTLIPMFVFLILWSNFGSEHPWYATPDKAPRVWDWAQEDYDHFTERANFNCMTTFNETEFNYTDAKYCDDEGIVTECYPYDDLGNTINLTSEITTKEE